MVDITDLYSTVSRTRVSPQKSYVASYTITSSLADTGATLTVANNQYYAVVWGYQATSSETLTVKLLQGATTKETWSTGVSSTSGITTWFCSGIYKNTSGSSQTVKLQSSGSVGGITTLYSVSLLSGTIIQQLGITGKSTLPLKCYINNLEFVGGIPTIFGSFEKYYGFGAGQDNTVTTTLLLSNLNIVVDYFEFEIFLLNSTGSITADKSFGLIAFDFDGKTLAL